jgi:hypothetical protein
MDVIFVVGQSKHGSDGRACGLSRLVNAAEENPVQQAKWSGISGSEPCCIALQVALPQLSDLLVAGLSNPPATCVL